MRKLFFVLALLFATSARATTWQSPSCSQTDVQATISAGTTVTGDTVQVLGPCTLQFSSFVTIPSSKGITVQGVNSPVISSTSEGFIINAGANTTRITGFTCFRAGNVPADSNGHCLQVVTSAGTATWRYDHNTLCAGGGACTTGNTIFISITGLGPGLIDHNSFKGNGSAWIQEFADGGSGAGWADNIVPGGSQMLFIEDNTFTNPVCNASSQGCQATNSGGWIQAYYGARNVIRHNTFTMVTIDQHGSANGGNECTGGGSACIGAEGVRWYEIYSNDFEGVQGVNPANQNQWFSYMDVRAGAGVIYSNTFNPNGVLAASNQLGVRLREENTLAWPQAYQIGSGIGSTISPHSSCSGVNTAPTHLWSNTGTFNFFNSPVTGNVQQNRDYFLDGSQPASMHWEEASGDTCSTTYAYTAFTYPHPLIGGSSIPTVAITAPSPGTVSGSVTLTGTCVPSGATITSVQFQIDGQNYGAAGSTSPYSPAAWDSTKAANAPSTHTIAFSCTDSNGLQNQTSIMVTVSNSSSGCFTSSNDWSANQSFNPAASTFTATFTVKTNSASTNALVGLSQGVATIDTSLATIILFNPGGAIQVRNGGTYTADNVVTIVPGTVYTFSMTVNITNHTYSVQETSPSNVSLATNYAFRTEQATVSGLDTINEQGVTATPNTEQLCNFAVAPVIAFAPVPLNFNNVTQGSTKALTETVSNISFPSTETLGNSPHYYTITGANATDFTVTGGGLTDGGTISGGNSGTSVITFTPAACAVSTGCPETATLTILGTAGGTVTLNGTGFPIPSQPAPSAPAAILSYISNGSMLLTITNAPKCATICTVTLACQGACKPTFGVTIQ